MNTQIWHETTPSTSYASLADFMEFAIPRLSRAEMLECCDIMLDAVRQRDLAAACAIANGVDQPALRRA